MAKTKIIIFGSPTSKDGFSPVITMFRNLIARKNFKDLDLSFVDIETTGRGVRHEIIEIAVVKASGYNFAILDEWEVKTKPKRLDLADPESLKVNHYNDADWAEAMELKDALRIFLKKTENSILVGHNIVFDWFFIHKAIEENNFSPTFWFKGLDTISLAWLKLRQDPKINSLSFKELKKYFGIEQEKAHSALDDARTTYKIFMKIIEYDKSQSPQKQQKQLSI